jgi:5-methylcytosine-specific restriction protein A
MPVFRIADLPAPVTAAKADWLVASHWIGFTPASDAPQAMPQCQATVSRQFGSGYVLEYITRSFGSPNAGFEADAGYLTERAAHAEVAGRLVAVHRLRPTARPLRAIVGDADFERMQDMWAEDGKRQRWSVAFPIVESYEISTRPVANRLFSPEAMQRLFAHPSATLRPMNDDERAFIADLPLLPRATSNSWVGIEDDIAAAEQSTIDKRITKNIDIDLKASAMEGMTEEQRAKIRLRAAWLAQKFVIQRQKAGTLTCDTCSFDPVTLINGAAIRPRSLLDVHHLHPLDEGRRVTTVADFALLCPTCHRYKHALISAQLAG